MGERERVLLIGLVAGGAAVAFARDLFAPIRVLARPLAKTALRGGLTALERGRERAALVAEQLSDLAAEAEAERASRSAPR